MINENGTVFLLNKTVEFAPTIEREVSKTAKRFIYISSALLQSLIDQEKSGMNNETVGSADQIKKNIVLSLQKEKIWGRKFKIVLKSKHSRKENGLAFKF